MADCNEILLIKCGELALKGLNRGTFEAVLMKNLRRRLTPLGHFHLRIGRNLRVENVGKRQLAVETVVGGLHNFFYDLLGEEGKRYIPYLMTVGIYIAVANMIGLFGLKSPTKDVGVTGALALMSIVLIEYSGVRAKGMKGFLKSFAEPIPIMLPMNILEIFIRPLSLCMRLFGNILGAFVIMELIKIVAPLLVPVPLSLYFDLFDGFIQAYVFVFLTSLFIKESIE